jgi:hypothetical protein
MSNDNNIQWKRISVEGAAIVFSILLAFSIDAWWDEQQERNDERSFLVAIRNELENNLTEIEKELTYRHAVDESIMKILAAGAGEIEVDPDELDRLIGDLLWWGKAKFQTGALDSTLLGGVLPLIENEDLRHLLAGLPVEYEQIRSLERQDKETLSNKIYPYIFKNASLPQISNTLTVQPGTGENLTSSKYPVGAHNDHSSVLQDSEFLSIVTKSRYDQIDAIWGYGVLRAKITQVIEVINGELN